MNRFEIVAGVGLIATIPACKDKGDTGDGAGLESVSLGSKTTDSNELVSLTVDVPEGSTSALVHCGPYGSLLGTAWSMTKPSGDLYYTNEFHESHTATKMRSGYQDNFLPLLFPVSPDANITDGSWKVEVWVDVADGSSTEVDCGAVFRTSEVPSKTEVNINLIFVGIDGVDADNAADNSAVKTMLSTMDDIWGNVGLRIGKVSYFDFSGDVDKYAVVDISDDDSTELNELFEQSPDDRQQVINVFLVQEISNSDGGTIFGIAAGPPGAATLTGTSKSGMVVGAGALADEADFVSLVAAHEGAHFLGLFHTTDKDGSSHDPLADTPECGASSDSNGNGEVSTSECAGDGADYVMFWSPDEGTTKMSADQGWVLRRNPAVQ